MPLVAAELPDGKEAQTKPVVLVCMLRLHPMLYTALWLLQKSKVGVVCSLEKPKCFGTCDLAEGHFLVC